MTVHYPHRPQPSPHRFPAMAEKFGVPKVHIPKWRLKATIALGLFPIIWILPKCRCCKQPWPCTTLTTHYRHRLGWTVDLTDRYKALATKRRRNQAEGVRSRREFGSLEGACRRRRGSWRG